MNCDRSLFHDTRQPRSVQRRENAATPSSVLKTRILRPPRSMGTASPSGMRDSAPINTVSDSLLACVGKRNCMKRKPSVPMPKSIPNPITAWLRKRRRPISSCTIAMALPLVAFLTVLMKIQSHPFRLFVDARCDDHREDLHQQPGHHAGHDPRGKGGHHLSEKLIRISVEQPVASPCVDFGRRKQTGRDHPPRASDPVHSEDIQGVVVPQNELH